MQALQRLVSAYVALARVIPAEQSRTAALIRSGGRQQALARLRAEIAELASALDGSHRHKDEKTAAARRLLGARGFDEARADLLLEAHQVSYWWLVSELAGGGAPDASSIASALADGAASRAAALGEQAAAAAERPTAVSVYGLIGRALAECGLPLDLFAELDLAEMQRRPYMQEALRGA